MSGRPTICRLWLWYFPRLMERTTPFISMPLTESQHFSSWVQTHQIKRLDSYPRWFHFPLSHSFSAAGQSFVWWVSYWSAWIDQLKKHLREIQSGNGTELISKITARFGSFLHVHLRLTAFPVDLLQNRLTIKYFDSDMLTLWYYLQIFPASHRTWFSSSGVPSQEKLQYDLHFSNSIIKSSTVHRLLVAYAWFDSPSTTTLLTMS